MVCKVASVVCVCFAVSVIGFVPRSQGCATLHIWRFKGGRGLFVSEKSVHGSQWLVRVFSRCPRGVRQALQIGGGDYGEELEDKSQESASSDTEPEEPAGPAGLNAAGPQHVVCACFFPD